MNALFITRHYLDQMLGGPNCSKAFVRALAEICPGLTIVYPEHEEKTTRFDFLSDGSKPKLQPVFDRRSKLRKLIDMYRGRLHRFYGVVPELLKAHSFDVIFIDHSFTASSGIVEAAQSCGAKIVTFHHNVESQYIRDNQQSILFRYPYNKYSLEAERKAVLASDLNLVLTDYDKSFFVSSYPEKANSFRTVGVFEYEDNENVRISTAVGHTFVISGSLCARQTEIPMATFLDEYMDVLNEVCPDAHLVITGRNPSAVIYQKAERFGNVEIVPNPDDIVAKVMESNYYLCPIYTGGGLKLRCMDALRVGLPVLAHENGMRGYEAIESDGYMFSYSTKQEFADGISHMLSLECTHADVANSFQSHFSYNAGRDRLKSLLSAII